MKTLPFIGLTASQKILARRRVGDVLVKMARESGKVCLDSGDDVTARSTYSMTRSGWIWGIVLPENLNWKG
jgi:hypothetical protein